MECGGPVHGCTRAESECNRAGGSDRLIGGQTCLSLRLQNTRVCWREIESKACPLVQESIYMRYGPLACNLQLCTVTQHEQHRNSALCIEDLKYMGTNFLSKQPKNVREEKKPKIFKRKLKTFLIENPFYYILEFMEK